MGQGKDKEKLGKERGESIGNRQEMRGKKWVGQGLERRAGKE